MVGYGLPQHQDLLKSFLEELRLKGYHTIDITGIVPDGLAVKENKIFAVEILGVDKIPQCGFSNMYTVNQKRDNYEMFDGVLFKVYERAKYMSSEESKINAKRIVDDFINKRL